MELQRILAKDTREAMAKVHALYGNDALVVSNKKANKQTEIIVAIEMADDAQKMLNNLHMPKTQVPAIAKSSTSNFGEIIESKIFKTVPTMNDDIATSSCEKSNAEAITAPQDRDYLKARELVDLVKKELSAMRRELKISQQIDADSALKKMPPELGVLITTLNNTGMPAPLSIMVSNLIAKEVEIDSAINLISASLGSAINHVSVLEDMQGVHVIAGRSGSENTLMALRLAKQKAFDYGGQNIAIITYNHRQTGSWSQTQILGLQSGVETYHASTPKMLEYVIAGLEGPKLTIIETAGINLEHQVQEVCASFPDAKKHLLLSADASEVSVNRYLQRTGIDWDSVMLSQLEQDIRPWPVINTLVATGMAISLAASDSSLSSEAFPTVSYTHLTLPTIYSV